MNKELWSVRELTKLAVDRLERELRRIRFPPTVRVPVEKVPLSEESSCATEMVWPT
jgi:hypothetical protein